MLSVISSVEKRLDPTRRLAEQTTEWILEELPRLHQEVRRVQQLLSERIEAVTAAGCTYEDVEVILHQGIEAMRRTAEQEKRRRLGNVVVNGLCEPAWDKATNRLMLRFADELEDEHIELLRSHARLDRDEPTTRSTPTSRRAILERQAVRDALERELIARMLLDEEIKPPREPKSKHELRIPEQRRVSVSQLGRRFLEFLRDPDATESHAFDPVGPLRGP